MPALIVKLPRNRDFCGEIRLIDDHGATVAGPCPIAGRATDAAAQAAGNPARSPLTRYGDTPTGRYKIRTILRSGDGTAYRQAAYGGNGVIVLDPCGGEAALAEANGRFHLFIQGGATTADGRLCATNGALRMQDDDLALLCGLLRDAAGSECWCVEDAAMPTTGEIAFDASAAAYDEGDPPPLIMRRTPQDFSRRRVMASGAILAASALPVSLPGFFIAASLPAPAMAQSAYENQTNPQGNNSDGDDNHQDNNGQPPSDDNQDHNLSPDSPNQDNGNGQNDDHDNNDNNDNNGNNNHNGSGGNAAPKAY